MPTPLLRPGGSRSALSAKVLLFASVYILHEKKPAFKQLLEENKLLTGALALEMSRLNLRP